MQVATQIIIHTTAFLSKQTKAKQFFFFTVHQQCCPMNMTTAQTLLSFSKEYVMYNHQNAVWEMIIPQLGRAKRQG